MGLKLTSQFMSESPGHPWKPERVRTVRFFRPFEGEGIGDWLRQEVLMNLNPGVIPEEVVPMEHNQLNFS